MTDYMQKQARLERACLFMAPIKRGDPQWLTNHGSQACRTAVTQTSEKPGLSCTCFNHEPSTVGIVRSCVKTEDRLMLRLIVIAVLILFGSACSRSEIAYQNADSLLQYYAWKTVRTSAAQRDQWQPVLQSTLRHHREHELPLVIAYLDLAARIISETDGSVGAACLVDGGLLVYQRHARLAVDLAVPLLMELDATQVERLAKHTTQRQQDAVERYQDPDPQRRKEARQERITDRIEQWTGKLNNGQREYINDALQHIPDLTASWLSYRAQQTKTMLTMLQTGAKAEALSTYLNDWWVHRNGLSTETRDKWDVARHEFVQLMDTLAAMLTDSQRRTLETRLAALREDLASFISSKPQPVKLQLVPACASSLSP